MIEIDPAEELKKLGLTDEDLEELNKELDEPDDDELPPEINKLIDIIADPNTSEQEKEEARRKLNPKMYDDEGNLVLNDDEFYSRIEADINELSRSE